MLREPIWVSNRRWRESGLLQTLRSWLSIQTFYWIRAHPERLALRYRNVRSTHAYAPRENDGLAVVARSKIDPRPLETPHDFIPPDGVRRRS
jgi:hypothetical protein